MFVRSGGSFVDTFGKDKRKEIRVSYETKVVLTKGSSQILAEATSIDLSVSGINLKTDEKIPVGTKCNVAIIFEGKTSRLLLSIKGVIARHTDIGLGIAYGKVEVDSFFHLNNLLNHNVLDPQTIEKEILLCNTHEWQN